MRRFYLIITLFLIAVCGFGQKSSHKISGIDLNENWYTLTNQSQLGYFVQENYRKKQNLQGVTVDIDEKYLEQNVNKDFLSIKFTELILSFPMGNQTNLNTLSPSLFMATKMYSSNEDYDAYNLEDFNKIVFILMNQFGAPNSTMKKDWGASFEWNLTNAQLILTSNKTQHIILIYIKQS
tara:strand:+ start:503 stop:1042 length:540 start_codon:yes stop_codon:yes gene_type:complete